MQTKTKKIIWEIGLLALLTLFIYPFVFKLFWGIIDCYQFDDNSVFLFSFPFFFIWGLAVILCPIKNVYIKIVLMYMGILIVMCIWPVPFFLSLVPA
jgi:hypothetical protein